MATPSNKPRDIKNLKARLGRTITPGQTGQAGTPGAFPGAPGAQGAQGSVPGATGPSGASVPPPVVGGGFPGGAPAGGSAPAASPFGRPLPAPNASVRSPLGGGAAPTGAPGLPSAQPAARTSTTPAVPGAAASGVGGAPRPDLFAPATAQQAAQSKRVTLVIDDSAVKDDEIGKASRGRMLAVAGVCGLLGIGVGFGVGNTADKRGQYSAAVRDGKDIYSKIQEVSKTVDSARDLIKKAVEASSGGPGKKASADFASVEQLVALKRPFSANEFHRRLYRAFGDNVVDELFDYYNNINMLFDGFTALGAKTAGAGRHEALQKSAAATDGLLNTDYGVVLSKSGEQFQGSIVFANVVPPAPAEANAKPEKEKKGGRGKKGKAAEAEAIKVKVSSSQGGQEVERTLFTGQNDVGESADKYVFLVDKVRSRTILGESANLFAKYRADLMDLSARMEKTQEVQGRLLKDLGPIASMKE